MPKDEVTLNILTSESMLPSKGLTAKQINKIVGRSDPIFDAFAKANPDALIRHPSNAKDSSYTPSMGEIVSLFGRAVQDKFSGDSAKSLRKNNPFAADRVILHRQSLKDGQGYREVFSFTGGSKSFKAGISSSPAPTAPKAAEVFTGDSHIFRGVTDFNSIKYKGSQGKTTGAAKHKEALQISEEKPWLQFKNTTPDNWNIIVKNPVSHLGVGGSPPSAPSLVSGSGGRRPPKAAAGGGGNPPDDPWNGKYGFDYSGNYTLYEGAPGHLGMFPEALENQKRIRADSIARNRSVPGGEQNNLFQAGGPTVPSKNAIDNWSRKAAKYSFFDWHKELTRKPIPSDMVGSRGKAITLRRDYKEPSTYSPSKDVTDYWPSIRKSYEGSITSGLWGDIKQAVGGVAKTFSPNQWANMGTNLGAGSVLSALNEVANGKVKEDSPLGNIVKLASGKGTGVSTESALAAKATSKAISDIEDKAGSGKKGRGGFFSQAGQQFRHAAIWSAYSPILGAVAGALSAPFSPYNSRAAGELMGLGASREEQLSSMRVHNAAGLQDPFRHSDQAIKTSKKFLGAVGWDASVANQIRASRMGDTINFVSKAADIDPEQLTQTAVRTAKMFGSSKYGEQENIERILGSMYKAGVLTSVKGPELMQAMAHGGAMYSSMFGDPGAAIGFVTPFIEAGVPNMGRVASHMRDGNSIEKMAKTQLLMELNYANMEKYGDNTKYVFGEETLNQLLKRKKGVPVNPQYHQRLQALGQEIAADMNDPIKNMQRHAKHGGHMKWANEYRVNIPNLEQMHGRFAMSAYELLQPGRAESTIDQFYSAKSGYDTNAAVEEQRKQLGIKTAASDAQQIKADVINYLTGDSPVGMMFRDTAAYVRGQTSSLVMQDSVRSIVQNEKNPEDIRTALAQTVMNIKEGIKQGHVNSSHFSSLNAENETPEGYVNALIKKYNKDDKYYEMYKIVGEIDDVPKEFDYTPKSWDGGTRDEYDWDFRPKSLKPGYGRSPKTQRAIDHTANVDPYELQYMGYGTGQTAGDAKKTWEGSTDNLYPGTPSYLNNPIKSVQETVTAGAEYFAPVIHELVKLGEIFKQTITQLPTPSVNVTVNQDGSKKDETTSSTTPAHFGVHPSGI